MTSRKKTSPVASVVSQAKKRVNGNFDSSKVKSTAELSILHSRVDQSPDPETGAPRLRVILPKKNGPEIFDFTPFLQAPLWSLFLAEGFRIRADANAKTTVYSEFRNLRMIARFLETAGVGPAQVNEAFWASYVAWLNAPQEGGEPWVPKTRNEKYSTFRRTITGLLDHPQHRSVAEHILYRSGFPTNPYPGSERAVIPTPVLRPDERLRLIEICLAEIEEIRRRHDESEILLQYGAQRLAKARAKNRLPPYDEIAVCAARLDELSGTEIPTKVKLRILDESLLAAIVKYHDGLKEIRRILYATNRDLIPFVILLGIRTAFNPTTLLGLTWTNVRRSHDGSTISFTGNKPRAAQPQTSTQEAEDSSCDAPSELGVQGGLSDILFVLESITKRTRCLASPVDRDFLFVAAQLTVNVTVNSFSQGSQFGDRIARKAFNDFRELHKLPHFNLKMLRATEAEIEYRRTNDILAVKDRMGHKNVQVTRTHYTSDWVRRHGQDRIGATQELILRWADSNGKCDPRGLRDPLDAPAATRGFGCLDSYDSPRAGQHKGRLCSAYGECPSCPLMLARSRDPQCAAFYIALRDAILEGKRGVTSGEAWSKRWAPILLDLECLVEEIPAEVKKVALGFRVTLPPVA